MPEWQIQPEDEEPPDDYPSTSSKNGRKSYTESAPLSRFQQAPHNQDGTDSNLIDLTSGNPPNAEGSSHASKVVSQDVDMEMCSDDDADFDSFAHEQLEMQVTDNNGFKEYNNQHRPISNRPSYGYVPPQKSQQEIQREEMEHQKTLSLQDRLRSLAGVPKEDPPAFQQPPPMYNDPNFHSANIRGPPPPQQHGRGFRGGRGGNRGHFRGRGGPPRGRGNWNRGGRGHW